MSRDLSMEIAVYDIILEVGTAITNEGSDAIEFQNSGDGEGIFIEKLAGTAYLKSLAQSTSVLIEPQPDKLILRAGNIDAGTFT